MKAKERAVRVECMGGCGKFQMIRPSKIDRSWPFFGCGKCVGCDAEERRPVPLGVEGLSGGRRLFRLPLSVRHGGGKTFARAVAGYLRRLYDQHHGGAAWTHIGWSPARKRGFAEKF